MRSNYSKLFPMWQPKASAWKQSWKCPGSVSGYKRETKPLPTGLPRAWVLQAWHGPWPGSRSWVKLLQEVGNESKQPEAQTRQCWCHKCPLWGAHNADPAVRLPGCHLWARAEGGASPAPTCLGNPSWARAALAGAGQRWSPRAQRALGDAWQQHILLPCTLGPTQPAAITAPLCHVWHFAVALGTALRGTGPFNAKPPDFLLIQSFCQRHFCFPNSVPFCFSLLASHHSCLLIQCWWNKAEGILVMFSHSWCTLALSPSTFLLTTLCFTNAAIWHNIAVFFCWHLSNQSPFFF